MLHLGSRVKAFFCLIRMLYITPIWWSWWDAIVKLNMATLVLSMILDQRILFSTSSTKVIAIDIDIQSTCIWYFSLFICLFAIADDLTWTQRVKVALDIARLVEHLHHHKPPYVLHFTHPALIMLDQVNFGFSSCTWYTHVCSMSKMIPLSHIIWPSLFHRITIQCYLTFLT